MTTFDGRKCNLCGGVIQSEGHINNCPTLKDQNMIYSRCELCDEIYPNHQTYCPNHTEENKIVLASSNDDKCIKKLFYLLESQYPDYKFYVYNSYTSSIYVYGMDDCISALRSFCEGYTAGWENATE
jgi:hypothetical protein